MNPIHTLGDEKMSLSKYSMFSGLIKPKHLEAIPQHARLAFNRLAKTQASLSPTITMLTKRKEKQAITNYTLYIRH